MPNCWANLWRKTAPCLQIRATYTWPTDRNISVKSKMTPHGRHGIWAATAQQHHNNSSRMMIFSWMVSILVVHYNLGQFWINVIYFERHPSLLCIMIRFSQNLSTNQLLTKNESFHPCPSLGRDGEIVWETKINIKFDFLREKLR